MVCFMFTCGWGRKAALCLLVLTLCARLYTAANANIKTNVQAEAKSPSSKLTLLLARKKNSLLALKRSIQKIQLNTIINEADKMDRLQILELFRRELEATDRSLRTVITDYERTLNSGFQSIDHIKKSCFKRLEDMRNVSLQVEEDFNAIQALQKEILLHHPSINEGGPSIMQDILHMLSHSADELERELKDDLFEHSLSHGDAEVVTVVKLNGQYGHSHVGMPDSAGQGFSVLVDSLSNLYSLSRPQDSTIPHEDHNLLYDILLVVLFCFLLGALLSLVRAPPVFGYILTGVLLGPSGLNWVKSIVQIETLGEFGVFLIMFVVGLEFSPDKLRKVWKTAVYCGNILLVVNVVVGGVVGAGLGVGLKQSLFLASCLSLSSTPLAVRFLDSETHTHSPADQDDSTLPSAPSPTAALDYVPHLMGILVMQDIQLGGIVALLPLAAISVGDSPSSIAGQIVDLFKAILGLGLLMLIARLLVTPTAEKGFSFMKGFLVSKEGTLVAALGACFASLILADKLGVALELGCFIAGIALGSKGHVAEKVFTLVEPVRDFLSCCFFASLGFHFFPTFIKSEISTVFVFTVVTLTLKFLTSFIIIGAFSKSYSWSTFLMSTGLSQISEFSFVLGSRGRRFGVLSREVYLLLLSTTILSLFLYPLVWKVAFTLSRRGMGSLGNTRHIQKLFWWRK